MVQEHLNKRTGELTRKVMVAIPLALMSRIDKQKNIRGVTRTRIILDCLDRQLPNPVGRPKSKRRYKR